MSVLTDLRIGETATLVALDLPDSVQNYLMHMGFVPDALVTVLRRAPAGDPRYMASTACRLPFAVRLLKPFMFAAPLKHRKARLMPGWRRSRKPRSLRTIWIFTNSPGRSDERLL